MGGRKERIWPAYLSRAAIVGETLQGGVLDKVSSGQQQPQVLESPRNLLRGSCSATFQSDMCERLLESTCGYLLARQLQQSLWKQPVQQAHSQEMVLTRTGVLPVLGGERKKAT